MGSHFKAKATFLYSFLIFELVFCKQISLPDITEQNSKKLSECGRCKVLVESFNHWLDKTSRGKFEGGDAAWEETKLKSYARSEIRLVEIQEGLCSELKKHQDSCYAASEEAEQTLEKWWFHEDPNSVDLFTWLCIETLQDCCPQNHFGESCLPCPMDRNNKICNGRGSCDGEGTRRGNGSCLCHKGYKGINCEECAKSFYNNDAECKPCHKACDECTGDGVAGCTTCKKGWEMDNGICVDIDECAESSACKANQYCVNREGSHICKSCDKSCKTCIGGGIVNCTTCEHSSVLWSGVCVDKHLKDELLMETLKRMVLYFGLLAMVLFICRTSKSLAAVIIVAIASFVYFSEKTARMNTVDVISNLYF